MSTSTTLLSLSYEHLSDAPFSSRPTLSDDDLEELLAFHEPDCIFVDAAGDSQAVGRLSTHSTATIVAGGKQFTTENLGHGTLAYLPPGDSATRHIQITSSGSGPLWVIDPELQVSTDMKTLSTTVSGRVNDASLPPAEQDIVFLAPELDAEYSATYDGRRIRGIGPLDKQGSEAVGAFTLQENGRASPTITDLSKLGLTAIDGVGPATASTLEANGFTSRAEIAAADFQKLTDLDGLGDTRASRIRAHAKALETGSVIRTGPGPVPGTDPLFIDIETDGLTPSIIWQIGVYDPNADEFRAFLVEDPENRGRAVTKFVASLGSRWEGRSIVAWNGWDFDFKFIRQKITQHYPDIRPLWESVHKVDLLDWAVRKNNAILPGRSNNLKAVSKALGFDRKEAGMSGAAVAALYRDWMADQSRSTEPDWARLKEYCENDVRALAAIYDAVESAEMAARPGDVATQTAAQTAQQSSISNY